jgi:hypothetical protein
MTSPKTILITAFVLFALIWAMMTNEGLSALPEDGAAGTGKNHALIIGIGNYKHWPKLASPPKDAAEISKALSSRYNFDKSNITLLTDKTTEKPTLVNILNAFDNISGKLTGADNLLVFFSGHSSEDDEGQTYWIPLDGKKKTKMTWLSHAGISEEYFSSEDFKAKNLCIITDSLFSNRLVRQKAISLTPFDLRYPEKIRERALRRSREVIAFGDQHWPGSKDTEGLGLFAYYIRKALLDNTLDIIDIENLIFDENIFFPITKIAGTRMVAGRIRTPMEKGGQFIITRVIPAAVANILQSGVEPKKGYLGGSFAFSAKTSDPASEVFLELGDKKYPMKGSGTDWQYDLIIDQLGDLPFTIAAINRNDETGKIAKGSVQTIKKAAEVANVVAAEISPKRGMQGDKFNFKVSTDIPASKVTLIINGKEKTMKGTETTWTLSETIEAFGKIDYKIVAFNREEIEGQTQTGSLTVDSSPVDILAVDQSPKTGYAGEEFTIKAQTTLPATSVSLMINGEIFPMKGSEKSWQLKKSIPDVGKKTYTVIAKNREGKEGKPREGTIVTKKVPALIPNITSLDASPDPSGKGYPGDKFEIKAVTSIAPEAVYVEIDGQKHKMQGSGSDWRYLATIDKLGVSDYKAYAVNKEGTQGPSKTGTVTTIKKPAALVHVITAKVAPQKGNTGKKFTFQAKTDKPAKAVLLLIGKTRQLMEGSGTDWSLTKKLDEAGDFKIVMIAANDDKKRGKEAATTLKIFAKRYEYNDDGTINDLITGKTRARFIDNGDGTVTDVFTSLMWLKQPKQIAENWESAVEYCRNLKIQDYSGWRLPTAAEWKTFADKKQQSPALPPGNPFNNVLTHTGYWSKTKHKFGPRYVYGMNLWYGKVGHQKKDDNGIVWPVRYVELADTEG